MCNFSGKLVAWLDHELQDAEAAEVERHVAACAECRGKIAAYEKISGAITCYCGEVVATDERRKALPWVPVLAAVAAIAVAAIVLSFPRTRTQIDKQSLRAGNPQTVASLAVAASPPAVEASREPIRKTRQRHIRKVAPHEQANWSADAPSVEIAIPAGALFPPGVFPEGVSFVADLSVAPDGSARRLRLQPTMIMTTVSSSR